MFFFQPSRQQNDEVNSENSSIENKTIRFVEKYTVITDRRRKTMRAPRSFKTADEEDPELEDILSISFTDMEQEQCHLPRMIALAMASIIDDATESCCIMSKTFGLPDLQLDMTQKSLAERNEQLRSHSTLFNPESLEDYSKTQKIYMIRKLHADIVFLQNILAKGVKCLLFDSNYHPWLMYIGNYDLELEQDSKLLEMVEKKTQTLRELKDQLHSDKIRFQSDSDELSLAIGRARDDLEDFIIHSEIKQVYLDNWEKSRRQQNYRVKTGREDMFQQRINTARSDSRKENRVHSEIGSYMAEFFQDTENSIQEWMNTYDKDIEKKEEDILKMGFNIESLNNDLNSLREQYDKRNQEINDWLEKKAEKERIEEEKRFLNRMATKIQAWWRGTMVRNKLGPYRPVSKRRDKKKKKK
ncbi:hypothetical protein HHI36_004683 [Cryptolaemus montrouzieri]|uniref:Dynein regulatory complex protein 9 n=1 Tax=Cryptolaemus montrouzieri TaxID=559131 RepID=A0ABD2NS76_9CUCU